MLILWFTDPIVLCTDKCVLENDTSKLKLCEADFMGSEMTNYALLFVHPERLSRTRHLDSE